MDEDVSALLDKAEESASRDDKSAHRWFVVSELDLSDMRLEHAIKGRGSNSV